jgi:L-aspartate oxidase
LYESAALPHKNDGFYSSIPVPPMSHSSSSPAPAYDVLVIGGGAAGLYAALCLPEHLRVGLITKDALSVSASDWAQGGIAAAIAPDDSPTLHIEDTLRAGAGLCDRPAVELLANEATHCIQALLEMGVGFDRQGENLALTLEAAHSRRRVLHAADTTGRAMISTLTAQVLQRPNVAVLSPAFVLDLWLDQDRCRGVCLLHNDQLTWVQAGAVVLATGGGGQVFAQTTNPAVSTGDGVAMAWRAGAELRDLEFVQFHPTALTKVGAPRFLISEAVRGEGAHLVDDRGDRFTFNYHPDGELAPRDVVSRSIFDHLQKTASDPTTANVWLDLRPIPGDRIRHRFPNIIQVCQTWGIDVFQAPIPVAPAAHYWMGGITTDLTSRATLPGLYAVGETTSTGVHGANRLASNSLLECLVFGAQLRKITPMDLFSWTEVPALSPLNWGEVSADPLVAELRRELPRLMWQAAGICREGSVLAAAIAQVETWRTAFAALPLSRLLTDLLPGQGGTVAIAAAQIREWGELRNLLDVGYLILKSGLFRQESRGGHYRSDYPQPSADWQTHTLVQGTDWLTAPGET